MTTGHVEIAGIRLELLPAGAVWWPAEAALLVADLHLGKAGVFRRAGLAVPEGDNAGTLNALSALIQAMAPKALYLLGDIVHAAPGQDPALLEQLAHWRARHSRLPMTAIRGNHDRDTGPLAGLLHWVAEGASHKGLRLFHHPPASASAVPWLAGHLHPVVKLQAGGDSLRLPAFVEVSDQGLILPAFGHFTGGHPMPRTPGHRRYATSGKQVFALDASD